MTHALRRLRIAVLGLLACSTVVLAQTSDNGSGNDDHSCDKAAKILARGKPQQKESWAYSTISGCAGGSEYLAAAWGDPPADSVLLRYLAYGSKSVRDRRIVGAVAAAVTNASLPHTVRLAAVNVLLAQYDRVSAVSSIWQQGNLGVGRMSDVYMTDGEQPVGPSDRQLIAATVIQLAKADADAWMRSLAQIVAADMGWK
jgi:hypothetical protein